jgi:hypothetical protein
MVMNILVDSFVRYSSATVMLGVFILDELQRSAVRDRDYLLEISVNYLL